MLTHLSVRNFTLIDQLELPLEPGFTVLTGETGAGKSIVFDALGLLLGSRASAEVIRNGADEAFVQAVFSPGEAEETISALLQEAGLPPGEDGVILRRVVSRSGPNRVFVNDTPATVSLLQRLVEPMVEVLGQHQHLTLQRAEVHRRLLDAFGGLSDQRASLSEAVSAWRAAREALEGLRSAAEGRAERIEFLRFQIGELEALELRAGEFEELETALGRARNLEKLREAAHTIRDRLRDGRGAAVEDLAAAEAALGKAAALDPTAAAFVPQLEEVRILVDDLAMEVASWSRDLEQDADLDEMEGRHEALRRAMRRFAVDESGLIERLAEMRSECDRLERYGESMASAERDEAEAFATALELGKALDDARREAASRLFASVEERLETLAMRGARLALDVRTPSSPAEERRQLGPEGLSQVEILFSANPGEPPRALGKVASGGELSRLLLAFKSALFARDPVHTYVFDEIDTGIGGAVAEVVGRMLDGLAAGRQVLCITHLPQIACFASRHYRVIKEVSGDRTISRLVLLDDTERIEEVARMLGGQRITDATRENARDLLENARES